MAKEVDLSGTNQSALIRSINIKGSVSISFSPIFYGHKGEVWEEMISQKFYQKFTYLV